MTEKRKPTYDLDAFKATFVSVEKLAVTGTALHFVLLPLLGVDVPK